MADLPMDRTMPGKPGEITELKLVQYILCDCVTYVKSKSDRLQELTRACYKVRWRGMRCCMRKGGHSVCTERLNQERSLE